jgi:hypothetical protein
VKQVGPVSRLEHGEQVWCGLPMIGKDEHVVAANDGTDGETGDVGLVGSARRRDSQQTAR